MELGLSVAGENAEHGSSAECCAAEALPGGAARAADGGTAAGGEGSRSWELVTSVGSLLPGWERAHVRAAAALGPAAGAGGCCWPIWACRGHRVPLATGQGTLLLLLRANLGGPGLLGISAAPGASAAEQLRAVPGRPDAPAPAERQLCSRWRLALLRLCRRLAWPLGAGCGCPLAVVMKMEDSRTKAFPFIFVMR